LDGSPDSGLLSGNNHENASTVLGTR